MISKQRQLPPASAYLPPTFIQADISLRPLFLGGVITQEPPHGNKTIKEGSGFWSGGSRVVKGVSRSVSPPPDPSGDRRTADGLHGDEDGPGRERCHPDSPRPPGTRIHVVPRRAQASRDINPEADPARRLSGFCCCCCLDAGGRCTETPSPLPDAARC